MARKAGLDYLNRKFGKRKVARLLKYFERWGTGALVVSTVVPLPFPTSAFFAVAGVLDCPLRTFMVVVALGRAVRYGAIAAIASHYGRRFVVGLRHLGRHSGPQAFSLPLPEQPWQPHPFPFRCGQRTAQRPRWHST